MDDDFKRMHKFVKFARKNGVSVIKFDNIELHVGPLPDKAPRGSKKSQSTPVNVPEGKVEHVYPDEPDLTPEQVLFYSVPDAGLDGPQEVQ